MKNFSGKMLFLDRSDINTDEIIPAKYLTEISKEALKPHLLEDLQLNGFAQAKDIKGKSVIITRANFGCGSSREHAPWALEVNGISRKFCKDIQAEYVQLRDDGSGTARPDYKSYFPGLFRQRDIH